MSTWTAVADRSAVEPEAPIAVKVGETDIGLYDVERRGVRDRGDLPARPAPS